MSKLVPLWAKLAMVVALVCAAILAYVAWADHIGDVRETAVRAVYDEAIEKQKLEAAEKLAAATADAQAKTTALVELKLLQEKDDAKNAGTVQSLRTQLAGSRLRDPYAARCGGSGSGPAPEAGTSAGGGLGGEAGGGGVLSVEFDEFLKAQALKADQINLAYASCRSTLLSEREVLK